MGSTELVDTHNLLGVASLPVPNVQELAKNSLTTIPERYIRFDEGQITSYDDSLSLSIPVIDLQKLLVADLPDHELLRLHSACKEWGFFQIVNHGISSSVIENMKTESCELFELSLEKKKKYWQTKESDVEGFGQAFVFSEDQKLDWGDQFYITTLPANRRKSLIYDILPRTLRERTENYAVELQKVAMFLAENMARVLNINESETKALLCNSNQSMRIGYYPPCPEPEKAIGITSHSDGTALTLLLHANDVQGLEIMKEGKWIPVKALPNAFVVNVGDILEVFSNGVYKSVLHRATVNSKKERISISSFFFPDRRTEFGPAYSLITSENPPVFERTIMEDFHRKYLSQRLKGKSMLESLKIETGR